MSDKKYIRANKDLITTKCRKCGNIVHKNNSKQIVYFCSPACRKEYKKG